LWCPERTKSQRTPRIKALEREVRELCQASEILRKTRAYFAQSEPPRPPIQTVITIATTSKSSRSARYTDCSIYLIIPYAARQIRPELYSADARNGEVVSRHIHRTWKIISKLKVPRKVWRQLQRGGLSLTRCTAERLMR